MNNRTLNFHGLDQRSQLCIRGEIQTGEPQNLRKSRPISFDGRHLKFLVYKQKKQEIRY
jgi:hypothetical protein